jgi:hypothetical protein
MRPSPATNDYVYGIAAGRRQPHRRRCRPSAGRARAGRGPAVGAASTDDDHRSCPGRDASRQPATARGPGSGRSACRHHGDAAPSGGPRSRPGRVDAGRGGVPVARLGGVPSCVDRTVGSRGCRTRSGCAQHPGAPGRLPRVEPPRRSGVHGPGPAARAAGATRGAGRVPRGVARRRTGRPLRGGDDRPPVPTPSRRTRRHPCCAGSTPVATCSGFTALSRHDTLRSASPSSTSPTDTRASCRCRSITSRPARGGFPAGTSTPNRVR